MLYLSIWREYKDMTFRRLYLIVEAQYRDSWYFQLWFRQAAQYTGAIAFSIILSHLFLGNHTIWNSLTYPHQWLPYSCRVNHGCLNHSQFALTVCWRQRFQWQQANDMKHTKCILCLGSWIDSSTSVILYTSNGWTAKLTPMCSPPKPMGSNHHHLVNWCTSEQPGIGSCCTVSNPIVPYFHDHIRDCRSRYRWVLSLLAVTKLTAGLRCPRPVDDIRYCRSMRACVVLHSARAGGRWFVGCCPA